MLNVFSGLSTWGNQRPSLGTPIDPSHPLSRDLKARWLFNDGSRDKLRDVTDLGSDGTLTGMDPATDWVGTEKGLALDFDGTDDYIASSTAFNPTGVGNLTLFALVYPRALTDSKGILSNSQGTGGTTVRCSFSVYATGGNRLMLQVGNGSAFDTVLSSIGFLVTNKWQFVAVSWFPNGSIVFYIDGCRVGTGTSTKVLATSTAGWNIGRNLASNSYCLNGQFIDAGIYSRTLSDDEHAQLAANAYCMFQRNVFVPRVEGVPTRAWKDGHLLKQTFKVWHGMVTGLGYWHQFNVCEPEIVAAVRGGATLRILRDSDNARIPIDIISKTPDRILLAMELPPEAVADDDYTLYVGLFGDEDGTYPTVGPVGLTIPSTTLGVNTPQLTVCKTAAGLDPYTPAEDVHPFVVNVPAGSTFANDGEGGIVHHVRLGTMYPLIGGANKSEYENPFFAFSRDGNGRVWEQSASLVDGNGYTITLDWMPPVSGNNSDCFMTFLTNTNVLRCMWRHLEQTVWSLLYCDLTCTDIQHITVGPIKIMTPEVVARMPVSPSVLKIGSTWYMFAVDPEATNFPVSVMRWESADFETVETPTWTNQTTVIPLAGEGPRGWYHLQFSIGPDGAIWGIASEWVSAGLYGLWMDLRVFRATDATGTSFEASKIRCVKTTDAYWCRQRLYKPSLFQASDGTWRIMVSGGGGASGNYLVAVIDVPRLTGYAVSADLVIGHDISSGYIVQPPMYAEWDFATVEEN